MSDQAEKLREHRQGNRLATASTARVIAVTSGKGGVGKTNLAVNTALAISRLGLRTGILDADLGMANVDILLGFVPKYNLSHVIYGYKRLADIILEGPENMKVIAGTTGIAELANLSPWRLQRFTNALQGIDQLLDVLLVDTGAGISRNVLNFVLASDEIIVVTTNEPTSITDAYGLIKVINNKNPQGKISLIVNMAKSEKDGTEVANKLQLVVKRFLDMEIHYLGWIPYDDSVLRAVQQQKPILQAYPRSQAAKAISDIASSLVEGPKPANSGIGNLFNRMIQMFPKI